MICHFRLLPSEELRDLVRAFIACMTQWRWILLGDEPRLAGLDYAGCRAAVAGAGLAWRQVFAGLQAMEAEALAAEREGRQ